MTLRRTDCGGFSAGSAAAGVPADAPRGERSEQRGGAAGSPRSVTRGESTPTTTSGQRVLIDWLTASFPAPDDTTPVQFMAEVSAAIGRPVTGVLGRGLFGFEHGLKLYTRAGSVEFALGSLCYGGESQAGRWMLNIPGSGCKLVGDWLKLRQLLEGYGARITRVDLAMDFLNGEHTVDDAVQMHRAGLFVNGGRPPSTTTAGDWLDGINGRTLYVGKASNGKMLRVYEKGIQLGDLSSKWCRFEVQLGNRDRVIPWDTLTTPAKFLAGAYPALEALIEDAAEAIPTERKAAAVTLGHLMFHLRRAYGKSIDAAMTYTDADAFDLVEELRVVGVPSRLPPAALDGRLTWGAVRPSKLLERALA